MKARRLLGHCQEFALVLQKEVPSRQVAFPGEVVPELDLQSCCSLFL